VDLSKGGVGVITDVTLHEADPIRLRLHPDRRASGVVLAGIVWNERVVRSANSAERKLVLGIMLSDVPDEYTRMLTDLGFRDEPPARASAVSDGPGVVSTERAVRRADRRRPSAVEIVHEPSPDQSLPRIKFPLPPPKPVPEDRLPQFCARVKQVGGARTRRLKVRAHSTREAEERVLAEVGEGWEILEIESPAG
jgi:hypothetical protein